MEKTCADAERQAGDVCLVESFGGIADLGSRVFREWEEGLESVAANMPG